MTRGSQPNGLQWTESSSRTTNPPPDTSQRRPILHAGIRAGSFAGVAAELVVTAARALDIPMRAGPIGTGPPRNHPSAPQRPSRALSPRGGG